MGDATKPPLRSRIDLWYPRVEDTERTPDHPQEVEVDLIDVRAANSLVIDYDFDRDGYRLRMSTVFEFDSADGEPDEGLVEVGFVPAWVKGHAPR
jgi:hypothetical protein